ncbi:hypothetical protein [Inquilinus sp. CA228]|uniref:hypothetical protein n=1 Tax=Inquilinus sp. CA228 TaxID=3455609 RepID=UPI003F8D4F16
MMDGLIVWAAIGPILAFVAGAIVVAWLDDDETEDLPLPDYLRRADGTASVPSFDLYGYHRSAASPLPGPGTGRPAGRPARSCLQCGRREE